MDDFALIVRGTGFTSPSPQELSVLHDHLFCVDDRGVLARIVPPGSAEHARLAARGGDHPSFLHLQPGQYLLPGFVDLHIHAPQWAQLGNALDLPLNDWLHTYTFPLEARYGDLAFARERYTHLVRSLLARGTTTALYFATVHRDSSLLLAELCAEAGQRGLVGKVVMDDPVENPENYRDRDTATALADTEGFIRDVAALRERTGAEVYPVVTPRFIPSCTDETLRGLGELAARYEVHVQSHCSEGDWEHGFVQDRFGKHDAFALHDFGLLTDRSVMAHCVLLDDDDVDLFRRTGTAVAHCPLSNAYFGDAVAPVRRYAARGVDVGLGTDISAGFAPGIWENIRQAVVSSRMLEDGVDRTRPTGRRGVPDSRLTLTEAFHFATTGGGRALGLPVGQLAEGCAWDAQLIDTAVPGASLPIFGDDDRHVFEKIMYLASAEHIRRVWVQGRQVAGRDGNVSAD